MKNERNLNEEGREKRILMIAPTPFFSHRGCHTRIYEEVKFLQKHGYRVKILTYHLGEDVPGFDIERIINIPWYKKSDAGPSWQKLLLDPLLLILAFSAMKRFRPGVVHCHLHEGAFAGIILRMFYRKNVKFIFDSQGSLVDELLSFNFIKKNGLIYRLLYRIERFIYQHSPSIVVSNGKNADFLLNEMRLSPEKVRMIPDGVDLSAMNPDPEEFARLQKKYKADPNKKTILYLGYMNKTEGIERLLQTFSHLSKIRKDVTLLLFGRPNIEHYSALVKDMGLSEVVTVGGAVPYPELYNYLALGDFAVSFKLPTSEGNGKLLPQAGVGLPTICYGHLSNRSILGDNGLYLDHEKSDEENAIQMSAYLDMSEEDRRALSQRLKMDASARFSWEKIIRDLEEIYRGGS
jgi:glycosyltransferase involved in cell wall biosynthesis